MNHRTLYDINFFFFVFAISLIYLFQVHTLAIWRFHGMSLLLVVVLILTMVLYVKSLSLYRSKERSILVLVSIFIIIISFQSNLYYGVMLWVLFALVVGAKGIEFRRIVRFHFIMEMLFFFSNIMFNSVGLINRSLLFLGDERESVFGENIVRASYGYPAATDFATHILYIMLDYWIIRSGKLNKIEILSFLIIIYCVFIYSDARQASMCMLLIVLFTFYVKHLKIKKTSICKPMSLFLIYSIPLMFVISILATLLYDNSSLEWVAADILVSGRLQLGAGAIEEYGFHLFGQKIEMVGGGSTGALAQYNYVDCGYIQFLLHWGVLAMAMYLCIFIKIGREAFKRGNIVLLIVLLISGISTVITQFLFYLNYSIIVLALMSNHDYLDSHIKSSLGRVSNKSDYCKEHGNYLC